MRIFNLITFIGFYLKEVLLSNLRVAQDVLRFKLDMTPAIVEVDVTELNDRQVVLAANFITMTPGTLGLYVSNDHNRLYVHSMYIDSDVETLGKELKQAYGERVRRVF